MLAIVVFKNKNAWFTIKWLPKNSTATFKEVSPYVLKGTLAYDNVKVNLLKNHGERRIYAQALNYFCEKEK